MRSIYDERFNDKLFDEIEFDDRKSILKFIQIFSLKQMNETSANKLK